MTAHIRWCRSERIILHLRNTMMPTDQCSMYARITNGHFYGRVAPRVAIFKSKTTMIFGTTNWIKTRKSLLGASYFWLQKKINKKLKPIFGDVEVRGSFCTYEILWCQLTNVVSSPTGSHIYIKRLVSRVMAPYQCIKWCLEYMWIGESSFFLRSRCRWSRRVVCPSEI